VGSASFGKREREKKQQERAAEKRRRRADKAEKPAEEEIDSAGLMERFRVLSEQFASGAVSAEAYEAERHTIFVSLGLEDALD
jgi:hypothetical protein